MLDNRIECLTIHIMIVLYPKQYAEFDFIGSDITSIKYSTTNNFWPFKSFGEDPKLGIKWIEWRTNGKPKKTEFCFKGTEENQCWIWLLLS